MFRAIAETQWKWTRGYALVATILGFIIPLASLQAAHVRVEANEFVSTMSAFGAAYAMLAAATGLVVGFLAWSHDHRGRHVYALTLPVSRARYALMRLGAGALFLVPPVLAVMLGGIAVAVFGAIPEGLRAYPVALALRFLFATLVAYTAFFAIASATQRAAGILLGVIATVLLVAYVLAIADSDIDFLPRVVAALFDSRGIFSVFTGRWTLIDA
jgi:hypothetical protein